MTEKRQPPFTRSPGTAEMLAALTIRKKYLDGSQWRSEDLFKKHKLADLSCGTGTLLRSGYHRMCRFHEEEGGTTDTVKKLHRDAMESGLIGTDISPIAAHLTASSLAAVGHGDPYGKTQIGWLKVGGDKKVIGALEYLNTNSAEDLFTKVTERSVGDQKPEEASSSSHIFVGNGNIDWILMNPPYSRTRGGQSAFNVAGLSEKERKECQNRWRELFSKEPVNNKAGMAASFLMLAKKKVKIGGRIGFVLPLTAAFAESWRITRKDIAQNFTDIVAIVVSAGAGTGQRCVIGRHPHGRNAVGGDKTQRRGQ